MTWANGPFQIRWQGAGCCKEQWRLQKLTNPASRGFACYLHGFRATCTGFLSRPASMLPLLTRLTPIVTMTFSF